MWLENVGNQSLDLFREVLEFGEVPSPCCMTPAHQVPECPQCKQEGIQSLGDEAEPNENNYLEEVMWADDQSKQATLWDFVCLVTLLPELGKQVMVVEVACDPYQEKHLPCNLQIQFWPWHSLGEILSIDHAHSAREIT